MCIICISLDNEKITTNEANEHLKQLKFHLNEEHIIEVSEKIWKMAQEEYEPNWCIVEGKVK